VLAAIVSSIARSTAARGAAVDRGAVLRPTGAREIADADLVARALAGDRWAEEALFRRHVAAVAGIATRLLGRREDAEDIVQDTFATALESLSALRDAGAVRAWLVQIAVRKAHRRFRRRKIARALGLDRATDDATLELLASDAADGEARAELRGVDRALAELPVAERMAWMLRHIEGESLEGVASACGCSLATAKRRIARADARVRTHVEDRDG